MTQIDYSARLTLVQTAIATLLANPVSTATDSEGNSVTYHDLDKLMKQERFLAAMVRRQGAGSAARFRRGAMR